MVHEGRADRRRPSVCWKMINALPEGATLNAAVRLNED